MRWRTYVAMGDSFTEGLDDAYPDGGYRGWADLVAARLAADAAEVDQAPGGFGYANLAVRGKLFDAIVTEQVPAALAMRPDLVSFAGGGNDVLRRRFDPVNMVTRFDATVRDLRATGADVLLFRFADLTPRLPGQRMIGPRVAVLNRAVGEVAERYGAHLIDLWSDDAFENPLMWSADRLHLSAAGHQRVAAHVLTALDRKPEPEWLVSPEWPAPMSWLAARAADLHWAGTHLVPWIKRRLTGRSSGDQVTAKRPVIGPL